MKRKALGRGLSALLSDVPEDLTNDVAPKAAESDISQKNVQEIAVESIQANRFQPRSKFLEEELHELAESIKAHGVLQPLLVRNDGTTGANQLIAGERRLRAAKLAGLATVPCIVLQAEEAQMLEIALVENVQRSNLTVVEEAKAYKHLIDRFELTQEDVAQRVGKSRVSIANTLRLLNLPKSIQNSVDDGKLSYGHARALLGLNSPHEMEAMAQRIINENLNVRDTERLIREESNKEPAEKQPKSQKGDPSEVDLHVQELQKTLEETFQTKAKIKLRGKKGVVEFEFYDFDHLQSLLNAWGVSLD